MGYIADYNGLDANKYNGSNDFRGFLAANGYENFLPYVGNDGKGDFRRMAQNPAYADQTQRNLGGAMQELHDWWGKNNAGRNKQYSVRPQGGYYDPRAAAEARARADEIAKYREQERVASEGLGRLDRQRDIWRGNVENNYANQLNDLENSYTQSKGAYEMNKRDSEAQNRAVRSQIMEDAIDQTRDLSNQISNSQNKILDLSKETPKALEKVEFKAPKLSDYSENVQGVKVDSGNPDHRQGSKTSLTHDLLRCLIRIRRKRIYRRKKGKLERAFFF